MPKGKGYSKKQKKIARIKKPRDKITKEDLKALRKKKKKMPPKKKKKTTRRKKK